MGQRPDHTSESHGIGHSGRAWPLACQNSLEGSCVCSIDGGKHRHKRHLLRIPTPPTWLPFAKRSVSKPLQRPCYPNNLVMIDAPWRQARINAKKVTHVRYDLQVVEHWVTFDISRSRPGR